MESLLNSQVIPFYRQYEDLNIFPNIEHFEYMSDTNYISYKDTNNKPQNVDDILKLFTHDNTQKQTTSKPQTQSQSKPQTQVLTQSTKTKNNRKPVYDFKKDDFVWFIYMKIYNMDVKDIARLKEEYHSYEIYNNFKNKLIKLCNNIVKNNNSDDAVSFVINNKKYSIYMNLIKYICKQFKFSFDVLFQELGNMSYISIETFSILCLVFDIPLIISHKKSCIIVDINSGTNTTEQKQYLLLCCKNNHNTQEFNKSISILDTEFTLTNMITMTYNELTNNYYVVKSLQKKIKSVSSYKVADLEKILQELKITTKNIQEFYTIDKIKKQHMYEYIKHIL